MPLVRAECRWLWLLKSLRRAAVRLPALGRDRPQWARARPRPPTRARFLGPILPPYQSPPCARGRGSPFRRPFVSYARLVNYEFVRAPLSMCSLAAFAGDFSLAIGIHRRKTATTLSMI